MKPLLHTSLALVVSAATSSAATITFGSGSVKNEGGLNQIVDGDHLRYSTLGITNGAGTGLVKNQTSQFTIQDNGNQVTLEMTWDTDGIVELNPNGVAFLSKDDKVTISFRVISGGLDSIAYTQLRIRALETEVDGSAGEGLRITDNLNHSNTWYSVQDANTPKNYDLIGTEVSILTSDSNYSGGDPVTPSADPDAGLNILSSENIDTWSWTIEGVHADPTDGVTFFALNQMHLEVTPSAMAVPEPSTTTLSTFGALTCLLRRRR